MPSHFDAAPYPERRGRATAQKLSFQMYANAPKKFVCIGAIHSSNKCGRLARRALYNSTALGARLAFIFSRGFRAAFFYLYHAHINWRDQSRADGEGSRHQKGGRMSSRRNSPAYREGPTSDWVMRAASGQQGRTTSSILPTRGRRVGRPIHLLHHVCRVGCVSCERKLFAWG